MHEFLFRLGYRIEVHPKIGSQKSTPDFYVKSDKELFYLEACIVSGLSNEETKRKKIEKQFDDILDQISSKYFVLIKHVKGTPSTQIKLNKVKNEVEVWLSTLDVNDPSEKIFIFEQSGFRVEIIAEPKPESIRGIRSKSPFLMTTYDAEFSYPQKSIRKSIEKKANKYKNLTTPYIIAINSLDPYADLSAMKEALYGDLVIKTDLKGNSWASTDKNGVWGNASDPKYTRVSAVLAFKDLFPWSVSKALSYLFLHPSAEHPYKGELNRLNQVRINESTKRLECINKEQLHSLLDLPESWPEIS